MSSRIRSSLTTEASKRLYKSMILPNLEYRCAVFHGCGKGNEEELERLQRHAARIVLKGHSQPCVRADLDTTFASLKMKTSRRIHLEIRFNPA